MPRTKQSSRRQQPPTTSAITPKAAHWKFGYASILGALRYVWKSLVISLTEWELLSYEQRNFLEEYGPAMWDAFRWLPGIAALQHSFRKFCRSGHDATASTPLLELPDEILVMIADYLRPARPYHACFNRSCSFNQQRKDLFNLGRTNTRLRRVLMPFLSKDVAIVRGWSRSYRALQTISNSREIQPHVQTLKLAVYTSVGTGWMPTTAVAPMLLKTLPTLSKLRTLHLHVPPECIARLKKELSRTPVRLPTVTNLVLCPGVDFVVSHCPNVVSISSVHKRHWTSSVQSFHYEPHARELISAAGSAEKLRHFQLKSGWDPALLQQVHETMPVLENLAMLGRLTCDGLRDLLPGLSSFRHLKDLALPNLRHLNIGYDDRYQAVCGNPYLGPGGDERWESDSRRWQKEALYAAKPVAELMCRHLEGLKRLWIGDTMLFTPVRTSNGTFDSVQWWSERRPQPATLSE